MMLFETALLGIYILVLHGILGAVLASFLTCFSWRICHGESVTKGRSHCDVCGHTLATKDLIPIVSYLFTKGRCRYCGEKISKLGFYGEVVLALLFMAATLRFSLTGELLLALMFICILYVVTLTDIYERIILDRCIVIAILVRVIYFFCIDAGEVSWKAFFLLFGNGFLIAVPILILTLVMEFFLKKEALGGGDIKLLFVLGMYLGWANSLLMLLFACVTGIMYLLKNGQGEDEGIFAPIPFGPFLAVGTVFAIFFGEWIISWYLSLFF